MGGGCHNSLLMATIFTNLDKIKIYYYMKTFLKKYIYITIGIALGIAGGFLYWRFAGCTSGTCPLKSNWIIMSVYGGLIGGLLGNVVQDIVRKRIKPAD